MRRLDDVKRRAKLGFSPPRRSGARNEMASSQILPDRFRDEDDANDDVTAPPMGRHAKHAQMPYMAQSIFSMIAAVGSKSDFHSRFDESSDSDADEANQPPGRKPAEVAELSSSSRLDPPEEADGHFLPPTQAGDRGRRRRNLSPDLRLLPPIAKLGLRERRRHAAEDQAQSVCTERPVMDAPSRRSHSLTPRLAPVLTRMLEAQARFRRADRSTESVESSHRPGSQKESSQSSTSSLSVKLMEIFGFDKPEKVLVEYACSLLQSVLLQGYMYVTEGHVCFYAYLPRKSNVAIRTGYLSKSGKKNPKYNRYWFSLKGDVLAYFADPSNLYFPSGHIDLRYGISASLTEGKAKELDSRDFQITTAQRTYHFRADSSISAKDWVKALQTVIFRTHNDGDSIKLSFPIENIIDIEESPLGDVAATLKIRAVESGETYAIDEYYFSFFDSGRDAYSFLKKLIESSSDQRDGGHRDHDAHSADRPFEHWQQKSRASVSDSHSAERASISRRRSASTSELATKADTANERRSARRRRSSHSFVNNLEQGTESSALIQSMPGTSESASQILNRSDVFKAPTIHNLRRRQSDSETDGRRHSEETARSAPAQTGSSGAGPKSGHEMQYLASESDQDQSAHLSTQSPAATLHELVKAGAYPLQRAAGFAEFLKSRSKQMSNLLATESMGYLEKVSGMWAGGGQHYGESERILPGDLAAEIEDTEESSRHGDRFRAHFALPPTEKLQATYYAYLHRVLPLYGKIYISQRKLCFRSLLPGTRTKMILPIKDVENVEKEKGFRLRYHGLVVIIRGHEELFFEFTAVDARDDCAVTIHRNIESIRFLMKSGLLAEHEKEEAEAAKAEHLMLQEARLDVTDERAQPTLARNESSDLHPIFDDPRASIINFKPAESLRITCLTIGSRGDVQPYIALCKGLLAEGHRPKIATHAEFEPWVRKHGIDFAPVDGDPAELMRICVENGMFTYSFLKEATAKFRGWIDDLLTSAWEGCRDSDLLIESPSAMAGIHIAEALRIPYFRAFTMPWTRTRAYPHAFAVPDHRMGGAYNHITYVMFDHIFWKAIAGQVNRWRKHELGLKATTIEKMQPNKVPFLYNYSPSVVPPPLDYPDWIRVTGYWFLNEGVGWEPPRKMTEFLDRARADGKKVVYIGFGSIVVSDPAALTRTVVESVRKADVRCILSKGWSDRLGDPTNVRTEISLPPEILRIDSAPHDWLFSQIDAAVHHGGAGTTGASLRAGIPTIIKPFFGDQFFFGTRVEDLGVGICMKKLNVSVFSRALWEATHSERMIVKARDLGERIRKENGVATAIQAIYRDLEYAKTLARQRSAASATPFSPKPLPQDAVDSGTTSAAADDDDDMDDSEEWTFIGGDDSDIDISRRMKERELADTSSSESRPRPPRF